MKRTTRRVGAARTLLLSLVVIVGALGCIVCLHGSAADVAAQSTMPGAAPPANGSQPMGTPPGGMAPNGPPPAGGMPGGVPPQGGMQQNGTPPQGGMPDGAPPGGSMPGDSAGASSANLSGARTVDGETVAETGKTYASSTDDVSAVYVTGGGDLTLVDPTISTTGNTSSNDASSFYGLNAGVLASNGTVTITGGSIATAGTGANGAFPYGPNASISLDGVTITATGGGGHGVMASGGGVLTLKDVEITTSGANSAPIATDRGGGTVTVMGGTVVASGRDSPGIYSTGAITVIGGTITATSAEAAVIEGRNSITLVDTELVGSKGTRDRGIMVYQSMSGDADVGPGSLSMTGGSYDWTSTTGPAFYVTNTNATITLSGVTVTNTAAELLNVSAGGWGTAGSNGGTVVFTADDEALTGSITADAISAVTVVLQNGTTLSGAITNAAIGLDASSTWTVTGDSMLTTLTDPAGISGSTITNIVGNGHTVTYDATLTGNRALGGKTFALVSGGTLAPATAGSGTVPPTPSTTTTTAGFDPLPLAVGALAVGAYVLSGRRR